MIRWNNTLTIGFYDKDTEKQEMREEEIKSTITDILLNKYNIFAFTMWDCEGVYKMDSTGNVIREKSVKVEIITDEELSYICRIIDDLKEGLNQECIMLQQKKESVLFA